jgi:predicted ATPase with chaperone activity
MMEMAPLSPEQFFNLRKSENTESILCRLNEAKNNPEPNDKLNDDCYALAKNAMQKLSLTPKRMSYVFSIAKTIARLEGAKLIEPHHIAEAVLYQNIHDKI